MQGPPHSCDDHVKNMTREELEMLRRWEKLSIEQAAGERRRPDLPLHDGEYLPSFYCALLQSVRTDRSEDSAGVVERLREDSSSREDMTSLHNSSLPSIRDEAEAEDLSLSSENNSEKIEMESDQTVETDKEGYGGGRSPPTQQTRK